MSQVQVIEVAADDADVRLDRWFKRHFPALGHGRLEKLLRTGQVRVDGGRAKAATRLEAGQKVRVPPLGAEDEAPRAPRHALDDADATWIQNLVLHRDPQVIVLNKPPGIAVQGGSKVSRHLDGMLDGLRFDAPDRPRLVHRLDKETSGVLLLGRSAAAAAKLAESFRGREAVKTYWALVAGVPTARSGRIDLPLAKRLVGGEEKAVVDREEGKRAMTDFTVIDHAGKRVAWLALRPLTGRNHQLRVHCAELGTPIVGDRKYGGERATATGLAAGGVVFLHARSIALPHPAGDTLSVTAPLPPSMVEAWRFFGFDPRQGDTAFDDWE